MSVGKMKSQIMKRSIIIFSLTLFVLGIASVSAQEIRHKQEVIDSLTTLDPEIRGYFPRWKICEPDLQVHIYQAFVSLGYDKSKLSMQNIEILAAPRERDNDPFEILLITSGEQSMKAVEIESNLGDIFIGMIVGTYFYQGQNRGYPNYNESKRDYCYKDMPIEIPLTVSQAEAIISYLEPTNVKHAFTLSLFDQAVKIGGSGFWLRSMIGTDPIGYHFWSSGEAKVVLQRPLYINDDYRTRGRIPYLINAYLGGGYRITSGMENSSSILNWVQNRQINGSPGGKLIAGADLYMPFHPEAGVSFNLEIPLQSLYTESINEENYTKRMADPADEVDFFDGDYRKDLGYRINEVVPVIRTSGQFTLFYNWWMNEKNPENYVRFDLGVSYSEIQDYAFYKDSSLVPYISDENIHGLRTYKPNELGDWIFFKAEYRNQAAFPFGFSMQISNQIFLGRVYIPLLGNWFYVEGKYSTPMRGLRPFEVKNFFMISPVLRLTI